MYNNTSNPFDSYWVRDDFQVSMVRLDPRAAATPPKPRVNELLRTSLARYPRPVFVKANFLPSPIFHRDYGGWLPKWMCQFDLGSCHLVPRGLFRFVPTESSRVDPSPSQTNSTGTKGWCRSILKTGLPVGRLDR
jgi:hypothetical protein